MVDGRYVAPMAEGKKKKAKKAKEARTAPRSERRFLPQQSPMTMAIMVAGALGSALLGAGVYAQFLRESPHPQGRFIVAAGAAVLAVLILFAPDFAGPVSVGDSGVAEGEGEAETRLLWCDIEAVKLNGGHLELVGSQNRVRIPLATHAQAAAWAVHEADARIPRRVELSEGEREKLPKRDESAGEVRQLPEPQVAGRRCKASDRVISYEPDARICPTCGECYHKDALPEVCVTCSGRLDEPHVVKNG